MHACRRRRKSIMKVRFGRTGHVLLCFAGILVGDEKNVTIDACYSLVTFYFSALFMFCYSHSHTAKHN